MYFFNSKIFKNKKIILTGASGKIGLLIANYFYENKANLILIDKNINPIKRKFHRRRTKKSKIRFYECDFEKELERKKIFLKISKENKKIDLLINNAAFVGDSNLSGWNTSFEKQSVETWNRCLNVNLTSVFDFIKILNNGKNFNFNSSIINISSIYGFLAPDKNLYKNTKINNPAAYSVSKSGLNYLTKWLAVELAPRVRVNSISLGGVKRKQEINFIKKYVKDTPLKRMAVEKDILGSLIYLGSNLSAYVTGHNIIIDGGKSLP